MKLDAHIESVDQLDEDLAQFAELTGLETTLREAAEKVRGETRRRLSNRSDATAVAIANALEVERVGDLSYTVGTNLDHGRYVEFGTRRLAARPWLAPALEAVVPYINATLRSFFASALRATARH